MLDNTYLHTKSGVIFGRYKDMLGILGILGIFGWYLENKISRKVELYHDPSGVSW